VVARHPGRRERLAAAGVAVLAPREVPPAEADLVIDCTGDADGFTLAREAVRPRGTIVLKSTYAGEATLNLSTVVVDEVRMIGSRCGPFRPALELLESGQLEVADLVERRFSLARGVEAFSEAARPGALKVLIEP